MSAVLTDPSQPPVPAAVRAGWRSAWGPWALAGVVLTVTAWAGASRYRDFPTAAATSVTYTIAAPQVIAPPADAKAMAGEALSLKMAGAIEGAQTVR